MDREEEKQSFESPLLFNDQESQHGFKKSLNKASILAEMKKQLWLAGPLISVSVLLYSLQVISVMFVGHLGELPLSGASMATSFASVTGFSLLEVYWSMASVLSEADGIDNTDTDELELVVVTLTDLDAMDGKSSVSLLVECASSPDVSTRQALANALATPPSMWTLGNAGMGALQRLTDDSNPAIASTASKAIDELKKQLEIVEGDSWIFTVNQKAKGKLDVLAIDSNDAETK